MLGLLVASEGYALSQPSPRWSKKHIITIPLSIFVWWLVLTVAA